MPDHRVLWINTGGTIVSRPYNPHSFIRFVRPLPLEESGKLFHEMLMRLDGAHEYVDSFSFGSAQKPESVLKRFQKDSKRFSPSDIKALAELIAQDDHDRILITHGTDNMAKNTTLLKEALAELGVNKTVIVTGAMVPMSVRDKYPGLGDAEDNIRYALEAFEKEPAGTYIFGCNQQGERSCMDPASVTKDWDLSRQYKRFTLMPTETTLSK